ncbi:MAG: autotransporter domain-containing protein [Magnetococcales bacterium]|nr:autotransporter domain-containing protein [Magnetococcales bacterium]
MIGPSSSFKRAAQKSTAALRLGPAADGQQSGVAAGDAVPQSSFDNGLWTNISYTHTTDKALNRVTGGLVDQDKTNVGLGIFGYDRKIVPEFVVGVALAYDDLNINSGIANGTHFNTWTLTPYLGYQFNENVGIDMMAGYSWVNDENDTGADGHRTMGSAGINGYLPLGDFNLAGRLGYLYSRSTVDIGLASGDRLGQLSAKVELNRPFMFEGSTGGIEPYVAATYEYDTTYEKTAVPYDRNGFVLTLGSRLYMTDQLNADIQASTTEGRSNVRNHTILANLRFMF